MTTIYMHNFRGFNDTALSLANVNFLVGENSAGKSSVLALINLISSADFWFSQNFNSPDYEFGAFRDIVSAASGTSMAEEFMFGVSLTLST